MSVSTVAATKARTPRFVVELAETVEDVRASQVLRFQVFAQEMGAQLPSESEGLDRDRYDDYCQHLLVRLADTGQVIGSTRILTQQGARLAGGFYSENEFDLDALLPLPGQVIEIGRTCIHPDYRNGATIQTLWMGLAEFMGTHRVDYLFGCASIGLEQGVEPVNHMLQRLQEKYLAPPSFKVVPRDGFSEKTVKAWEGKPPKLPPLLSAYMRLGAWVVGKACVDREFNCVDVFILLDVNNLSSRYRKHFALEQEPRHRETHAGGGVGLGLVAYPSRG